MSQPQEKDAHLSKRTKWIAVLTLSLIGIGLFVWATLPNLILATAPFLDEKGEEGGQWLRDRLVSCGPRAIGPVIREIRNGFWSRNYGYLPQVLERFGDPAHRALLVAIDAERDPNARVYLISALQIGFRDFSRLGAWLVDPSSSKIAAYKTHRFAAEIRSFFTNSPELYRDSQVNPDFVAWWKTNGNRISAVER